MNRNLSKHVITSIPVLTDLLHVTKNTSSEEDLGVSKSELLLVKLDGVKHSCGSPLVILGLGYCFGCKDVVPCLELRILNFVWEALDIRYCKSVN